MKPTKRVYTEAIDNYGETCMTRYNSHACRVLITIEYHLSNRGIEPKKHGPPFQSKENSCTHDLLTQQLKLFHMERHRLVKMSISKPNHCSLTIIVLIIIITHYSPYLSKSPKTQNVNASNQHRPNRYVFPLLLLPPQRPSPLPHPNKQLNTH